MTRWFERGGNDQLPESSRQRIDGVFGNLGDRCSRWAAASLAIAVACALALVVELGRPAPPRATLVCLAFGAGVAAGVAGALLWVGHRLEDGRRRALETMRPRHG